jgi:hypothetical protein
MSKWIITFNKDGNTTKLEVEAAQQPSMERVVDLVTEKAARENEPRELDEQDENQVAPAQLLEKRFGITITGIVRAD